MAEQERYEVKPVEGESFQGRQWGYVIERDGEELWHVVTGATGACWNVEDRLTVVETDPEVLHVCDLDELIAALQALRSSDAHKQLVAEWGDDG